MSSLAKAIEIEEVLYRRASLDTDPNIFTDIYRSDVNIVIWQRQIDKMLSEAVDELISTDNIKPVEIAVSPEHTHDELCRLLGGSSAAITLSKDIALLVDMFCCLFDLKRAGLRLTMLDKAMCPRFHVDKIPCRLVSTYQGVTTQWLAHDKVDRTKLGAGNNGKTDEDSGLFEHLEDIQQLNQGDVALLKGENWQDDNQGAGLVHRSPSVEQGAKRLLLTLDFM
ncbi:MAG: DUF1826 domain-containing protein [Pseudoalteromonas sp.]|uniref:DUF1826 domain-containing protein n=1 Tax=unclassified Pseudoalteromonas TaxID=194690 RepID=UPI003F95557A